MCIHPLTLGNMCAICVHMHVCVSCNCLGGVLGGLEQILLSKCKLMPDTEGSSRFRIPSETRDSKAKITRGINWFRPAQNERKPGLKAVDL